LRSGRHTSPMRASSCSMFSVWARVLRPTPPACPIAIQWVQSIPLSRRSNRGERRRARRKLHATFWFESRSKVSKPLLGSVAEQVLRSVNLPVITVGPEAHLGVDNDTRQRVILHATTLRETSSLSAALPARSPQAIERNWFCCTSSRRSTKCAANTCLHAWTRQRCTSCAFLPPSRRFGILLRAG